MIESGIVEKALGHTGGTATCSQRKTCTRCNQEYGSTDSSRHGTTEIRGLTVAACTTGGYTGDTYCKDCGAKTKTGIVTAASGHNYTSEVTKEPTTGSEGARTYTCFRCGHSCTESIPKLPDTGSNQPGDNQPGNDGTEGTKPEAGRPFIKGEYGKKGWQVIREEAENTKDGGTVTVDMNGAAVVPGSVLDGIKGRDITIVFDMGNMDHMGSRATWSVNGQGITAEKVGDIDFSVKTGTNTTPAGIISNVAGECYSIQISLAHEGEFGCTAVLSVYLGKEYAGRTASLYYYNKSSGELELVSTAEIAGDGTAGLAFSHASDYAIVVDKEADGEEPGENTHAQVGFVRLSKTVYTYNRKAKKPSVIAVDTDGKRIPGRYYTVSYQNNKKVGKATAAVTFKGGYSGTVKKTFTIRPAGTSIKRTRAVAGGFTVKWAKKAAQASGYQIQYSTNAGFKGNSTCSRLVKKASVTKKTIKKLKAGKKYYVRIRTYKA